MTTTLHITLLGACSASRDGAPITDAAFGRPAAKRLLAYLALHAGEALPRERIIEDLWPDSLPGRAAGSFKSTLSLLRKALEPDARPRSGGFIGSINRRLFSDAASALGGIDASVLPALNVEVNTAQLNAIGRVIEGGTSGGPRMALSTQARGSEDLVRLIDSRCAPLSFFARLYWPLIALLSVDPNDKYGNPGVGARRGIRSDDTLSYAIAFENVPTATAPAQIVIVSDTLDAAMLDLSTLRIHGVTISDTVVSLGDARAPLTREIDLTRTRDVIVHAEAVVTGNTLVVTLTSLDPATGEFVTDARAGFLPPNQNGLEGQGYVYFSIKPKSGLALGTVIRNKASIVFDENAAIDTPVWFNTIGFDTWMPLVRR
jgi:hypothetical protein